MLLFTRRKAGLGDVFFNNAQNVAILSTSKNVGREDEYHP